METLAEVRIFSRQQGTIRYLASPKTDSDLCLLEVNENGTAAGCRMVPAQDMKFYYIYILKSKIKNFIYIGYSEDLKTRIKTHNKGENTSTKPYIPFELIHYEAYRNINDAKRRERYLKTNKGRTTLKTMLKEYFSS